MKYSFLVNSLCLVSTASLLAIVPAQADETELVSATIPRLNELERPSTRAADLLAQSATVVQVTKVRLNPTASGIEVILETADGATIEAKTTTEGNTIVAEVSNAVLALPNNQAFAADNPAPGITKVSVTQLQGNRLQIQATGETALPVVAVRTSKRPVASVPVQPPDQEEVEVVVTGDRSIPYVSPNASTATRTDTPLRDVPQSIQVIPQQVLRDQQVTRIGEAARNVSGVTPQPGYAGATDNYTIRGFSAYRNLRNGFTDDGFYSFTDPANIERVEVLKGPASVLYGQFEPGGVVNYVTKKPLSEPYYAAQFTAGSYEFYRPSIDISGPLNSDKTLLYRLNVAYENSGSFRDFVGKELFVVAPTLSYKISDATTLSLEYEYINLDQTFDRGFPPLKESFDLPISRFLGEPTDSYDFTAHKFNYVLDHRFSNNWQLRNAFSLQTTDALRSNVQARNFLLEDDSRTLRRRFTEYPSETQAYSLQTDLIGNFNTGPVKHQVLLGFEFSKLIDQYEAVRAAFPSIDIFNPVYGFPIPTNFDDSFGNKTTTDTVGIYVQDQVTLLPNLKLLLGGRFDFVNSNVEEFPDLLNGSDSEKSSSYNEAFSPRVGLVYQPTEAISLYASYGRSFVPNTERTANGELLDPTRGKQYEVGIKAELLGGRLSTSLAAYEITKTNVATTDPNDTDFSIAAGEVKSRGIELDIAGEIAPGWNIIASYGLNDAFVSKDNSIPEGDKLVNAPTNSASLWTTYEIQKGNLRGLGFGGGLFFVGEREAELPNSITIPSYVRTDATIFYRRNNYQASLNFKNLFGIKYYDSQGFLLYPGAPFTVFGSISVKF